MATYAIGDLQGCCEDFLQLIKKLHFNADRDILWLAGDLVGRGPDSLNTLREVYARRDNVRIVLGNHDLHLLAVHAGVKQAKPKDNLTSLLQAPDANKLIGWLQQQPLLIHDTVLNFVMVHAGIHADWSLSQAKQYAAEVEHHLQTDAVGLFEHLYGDKPTAWSDSLSGYKRLRLVTNVLTRMRFCDKYGNLDLEAKGQPEAHSLLPWYSLPHRKTRDTSIVFGHWSTLGHRHTHNVYSLDTGCLWGGCLTALCLDNPEQIIQHGCAGFMQPC